MVRAAAFGARGRMVMQPPVSHTEAVSEFGAEISESAWREICKAFELHGGRLADLEVTRDNQNKNDTRGWKRRKSDAGNGIESALSGLLKIDRDFLAEAAQMVSAKHNGGLSYSCEQRLNRAIEEVMFLSWIMREAEPLSREIMTEAESRKALARDVFVALKSAGAMLSNGWALTQTAEKLAADETTLEKADLSGFERLAEVLRIHQGETPMATAKWLREALAQDR